MSGNANIEIRTFNVYKAGRCWNGAHRDSGTIIHLIQAEHDPESTWQKSLCGTKPGLRGYGWSVTTRESNCEKCKAKLSVTNKIKDL